jgi:hypothetical protein
MRRFTFTIEAALWCAIALLAALPRLLNLGSPLNNAEATTALSSLSAVRGQAVVFSNPLFELLQALLFAVFGASDATARLTSTIAGIALCLMPLALRGSLGRGRALAMGALLAVSPTLWFVSRQADGAMLAWALAFGAFCAWRGRNMLMAGALTGLLLACGQDAIPALALVVPAVLVTGGRRLATGEAPRFVIALIIAFLVAATAAMLRPLGLGDVFNGYAQWFGSLRETPALSAARLLLGFVASEPITWLAAIVGGIMLAAARQFNRAEAAWLVWLIGGVLLVILLPARDAGLLVPVVLGCAAYAAHAYARLVGSLIHEATWRREGAIAGIAFVLLLYAGLGVWQYAGQGQGSWLYPVLIALLLMLAILAAGSLGLETAAALRGTATALAASLLLYTLGAGLRLNHVRTDNPAEPYRAEVAANGLNTLVSVIRETGLRSEGEPNALAIEVDASAPAAVRWALRDLPSVSYAPATVPGSDTHSPPGAALTPDNGKPQSGGNFIGQAFVVATRAPLDGVGCTPQPQGGTDCLPLARWLAFRESPAQAQQSDRWVLWLRDDLAVKASGLE